MKTRNSRTAHSAVPTVPTFLALPTEIRYEIYKLVLTIPLLRLQETRAREREAVAASLRSSGRTTLEAEAKPKPLANLIERFTHLLRVCRQTYDEAFPFFYHHVTVSALIQQRSHSSRVSNLTLALWHQYTSQLLNV
jgi:hypothetical protein